MKRLALIASLAVTGTAAAQPGMTPLVRDLDESPPVPAVPAPTTPREYGFLGGGFLLGADQFIDAALVVEGGAHIAGPVSIRGLFAHGRVLDFEGGGRLERGLIGAEARGCRSQGMCGFLGLDVGYQTQVWESDSEMTEHHAGMLVDARAGFDVGGDTLRLRGAFELGRYHRHSDLYYDTSARWQGSAGLTFTVVYRL